MRFRLEKRLDDLTARQMDELASRAPNAHFTQHPGWAMVPSSDSRASNLFFLAQEGERLRAAALVKLRKTPLLGYSLADVFRGPMADSPEALLAALPALADLLEPMKPLALRIDPYWWGDGSDRVRAGLTALGFTGMDDPPWHVRSLEIEIDLDPEALISSFKPSTRRQVRKALKMQTEVREDLDDAALEQFHSLYRQMADSKGASLRPLEFFRGMRDMCRAWPDRGFFLSSWADGELLGAISVFTLGRRAIYAYGASSLRNPEVPKSHLLHYEAMQRARARGCTLYDMGGFAMGVGEEETRTPTQKINYFKSGFSGREVDFVAGSELLIRPGPYKLIKAMDRLARRRRPA